MTPKAFDAVRNRAGVLRLVNPDFTSSALVEWLGRCGFDGVFIDCEHRFASVEQVQDMVRAAHHAGMVALVRPETIHPAILIRYLDAGADGLVVPHVETGEQAAAVVDAVRAARWQDFGEKILIVMIESVAALGNADAILSVPGLSGVLVGPSDLSASMALHGQPTHPDVLGVFDDVVQKAHAAGLLAGVPLGYAGLRKPGRPGGYITYAHAEQLLAKASKDYLAAFDGP